LRRSHLFDPDRFGLPAGSADELFLERLKMIEAKEIGESLRKKYGQTPEQLNQLLRNNPEFLKERLKNLTLEDLPAELRKKFADRAQLQELIKYYLQNAKDLQPQGTEPNANGAQPAGTGPAPPPLSPAKIPPSDSAPPGNDSKNEEAAGPEAASENQQSNSVLGRWLLEAANRLKDEPAVRNSPALRNAIRDLTRKAEGADQRWKVLDKSANQIADKWARLGQVLPLNRLWPEKGFGLTPESFSKWRLPGTGPRVGRPAPSSVGRPATPDMADSKGWRLLAIIALLATVGFIVQRILARARARESSGGASGWKLGPWPVDPAAVRTREELIRAFEYLSLLRLGPAARHWHHLAIGSALSRFSRDACAMLSRPGNPSHQRPPGQGRESTPPTSGPHYASAEQHQAVVQLTSLYERARYAPAGEPLPESALATARHDLCLLAGVPTS
jgi:hypothetical protein